MGGSIVGDVARGAGDMMTFGSNELLGNPIGKIASGGLNPLNPSGPVPSAGNQTPMQMLQTSGGAPLLANIAMGADVYDSMASFLGLRKEDLMSAVAGKGGGMFSASDMASLKNLYNQLNAVQGNLEVKTNTVIQLVKDFPNYMASAIPQYTGIMDKQTRAAAQAALDQVSAKYAANGGLSSGAEAAAMARTAAETEQGNLAMGTQLAGADWQNQFNSAQALLNFQQKMLGQGTDKGFSAVQNALQQNAENARQGAGFQNQANANANGVQNAMFGALGGLAGSILGPVGSAAGSSLASSLFGSKANSPAGFSSSPRLNFNSGAGNTGFGPGSMLNPNQ